MGDETKWQSSPAKLSLAEQEVHVWRSPLDLPEKQLQLFAKTLSVDEQNRANRFRFEQHRNRFIAGRGILRSLLSKYLQVTPETLQFTYETRGKPALLNNKNLHFNLAHSQELALYAVTCDRLVGVDLEQVRSISDLESLTSRFFAFNEHAEICGLPADQRSAAFFRYWTCKEAYLKATGDGLAKLKDLEISLSPTPHLVRVPDRAITPLGNREATAHWSLQELVPAPGFVGAVASRFSEGAVISSKTITDRPLLKMFNFSI